MAEVKFNENGFAHVRLFIKPKYEPILSYLLYKVDSGANSNTISRAALHGLGYDDAWIKEGRQLVGSERPAVATGKYVDGCYKVVLPEIRIGIWVGTNWPFLVSLNEEVQFRLLFGTESMRCFKWFFDYERGVCSFNAIDGKRFDLFNKQEQSIHSVDEIDSISGGAGTFDLDVANNSIESVFGGFELTPSEQQVLHYMKITGSVELQDDGKYHTYPSGSIEKAEIMKAVQSLLMRKIIKKHDNAEIYTLL